MGSYSNNTGSISCIKCPKGTYSNSSNINCIPCPKGYYANVTGLSECKKCPKNTYQDKIGATSCKSCHNCGLIPEGATHCQMLKIVICPEDLGKLKN